MGVIWKMSGIFKADAEKVSAEIESIGPEATPAEIVEKAKDESTELHKCFEWDDSIAAQRWRLQQARQIVCFLVYEEEKKEETKEQAPIRFFVKASPSRGYQPTKLVVRDKDEYQAMLDRAVRELKAFKEKYQRLSELEAVFDAIDEL
jgi:hypothetical protein